MQTPEQQFYFQTQQSIRTLFGEDAPKTLDDFELWDWYGGVCPCGLAAGVCKVHKRARQNQRPPLTGWTKAIVMAGRGFGKTMVGAQWIRRKAETEPGCRLALVAPTAADTRDVMVEGPSGIMYVCPPWNRPKYEPSKRRLTWKNGTIATCFSAEEPDRLRGPNHHHAWIDEPGAWFHGSGTGTFNMLMFGLRLGTNPQVLATTTPRPTDLIKLIFNDPATHRMRGTTYDNREHLAASFYAEIVTTYEGTRLGEQELNAVLLEITEGAWFPNFTVGRHVSTDAEYKTGYQVHTAIDAGTSRHTGGVFFQIIPQMVGDPHVHVFGDYYAVDLVSEENAIAINQAVKSLSYSTPEIVRIDPAANARTGIGPAAYHEYERVFGSRLARWPMHGVVDGLDQIELLLGGPQKPPPGQAVKSPRILIHPRCKHLIDAFQNYRRKEQNGSFLDSPVDPQHPAEDLMDCLRGGIRDAFPEGRVVAPNFTRKSRSELFT